MYWLQCFCKAFILLWPVLRINNAKSYKSRQKYHNQMERIQHLIDKLVQQQNNGETAAQLLTTVHLLHQELVGHQQSTQTTTNSKVVVMMPGNISIKPIEAVANKPTETKVINDLPKLEIPEQDKRFIPAERISLPVEAVKESAEIKKDDRLETYSLPKLVVETKTVEAPKPVEKSPEPKELFSLHFDEMQEAPTLMQHSIREKEIHEVIAEKKESLNDKLKQEKLELGNTLKEAPIKDLRKGIGVNDKFLFINELFRGDEDMYERSIKTINGFRILPEAEYWMNRELKVKLGWNDNKDTVQHFYGVVRRRFS